MIIVNKAASKYYWARSMRCERMYSGVAGQVSGIFTAYSSNVSTQCAWTVSSHGDHAKTVKRPSCEATSAIESR